MTAPLDTARLAKLLALAGSDQDGEALAALRKASALLKGAGMSFTDLGQRLVAPVSPAFDLNAWAAEAATRPPPRPAPKDESYVDQHGNRWASKADYDGYVENHARRYAEECARWAPRRAEVLAKYGSEEAAIARDADEQALHDAAAPWLEDPHVPGLGREREAGRWHGRMGGWSLYGIDEPCAECVAALEAALPMPRTLREARAEYRRWEDRNEEIECALQNWGNGQLDLPAAWRSNRVRRLYESEMPIVTMDDLLVRLEAMTEEYFCGDMHEATVSILDALRRLVPGETPGVQSGQRSMDDIPSTAAVQNGHPARASDRRALVLAMLSNSDTSNWSDRAIARAASVSPTTVGALRRKAVR